MMRRMGFLRVPIFRALLCAVCAVACAAASAEASATDELRVLRLRHHAENHPHRDLAAEYDLLHEFARATGRQLRWHEAVRPAELLSLLRAGKGDLVIADLGPETSPGLTRTLPTGRYRYAAVGSAALRVSDPTELRGLRIAITLSSPLWPHLNRVAAGVEDLELTVLPDDTPREAILDAIADARYDGAVVPMAIGREALPPGVAYWFDFSPELDAVWQMRAARSDLGDALNAFLERYHAAVTRPQVGAAAAGRPPLRAITRIDPHNYFLRRGRPTGFEHGLVEAFAAGLGRSVEWLVAASETQALTWLREGRGDLVSTRVARTAVANDPVVRASRTYFHAAEVLLGRRDTAPTTLAGLRSRAVAVTRDSNAHRVLRDLNAAGLGARLVVLPAATPPEALAGMLRRGEASVAAIGAHALEQVRELEPGLAAGMSLPEPYPYRWITRSGSEALAIAIERFLTAAYRGETYNVLASRYVLRPRYLDYVADDRLSPYDDVVRQYAEAHNFDWRLIVALMYQESQFDPRAESDAGARGLMQLLPTTAADLGVGDPYNPAESIRGGVTYLSRLRRHFGLDVPPAERIWFALAAYNWGLQRVAAARAEAAAAGLDPNRWFNAVERVLRERMARAGGCSCGQTVVYVRAIRSLYRSYNSVYQAFNGGFAGQPPGAQPVAAPL